MSKDEIWRDVKGFEGQYQVSNKGNVYSVERINSRGHKCGGLMLKPTYDKDGYFLVSLYENNVKKGKRVHRLVAEAFIPNPNNFTEVNHKDEVKDNNELSNLEWCDSTYNINYGTRTERLRKKIRTVNIKTGEVLTFNSVREARDKGYNQGSVSQACRGIYKSTNGNLIGGDGRTYKGHRWYYEEEGE